MKFFEELHFWIGSILRGYKTSERVNELIQYILDNKDRVEVEKYNDTFIVLKIDGNLYAFWIYGGYFSYLSRCINCKESKFPSFGQTLYEEMMPSRSLCKQFKEAFEDTKFEAVRKYKSERTRSLILPAKED